MQYQLEGLLKHEVVPRSQARWRYKELQRQGAVVVFTSIC